MLNGVGGIVLIGIAPDGRPLGQQVSEHTLEDLANELRSIDPPAFPTIETIPLENGLSIIAIHITGGGGPYSYDHRPYIRYGATTSVMPRERYERLLLERLHGAHRWENQPAIGIGIEDLDQREIIVTIEEAIRRQRLDDPGTRDPLELLRGLNLIYDGYLLNAAMVLFAKPDRLFPHYQQCILRMARFRGHDKTEFLDNRQEVGHAFALLLHAQRFLRDHLPVAGRIIPNLFERIDDPLYPPAALREALANALCHRDYSIAGGSVNVAIYDDRLEITSTGMLPFGLTPADLLVPHTSRPWNPIIAHAFYRRGITEAWGRGTLKMAELTKQAGLALPEFESHAGEVIVRFRPIRYEAPLRIGHNLSELQRHLLEALSILQAASLADIIAHTQILAAERTIRENLAFLRQLGLIESVGHGRGARWIIRHTEK
jgi:ATP-dependent DNA helicase RecG